MKIIRRTLEFLFLSTIALASCLALYSHYTDSTNPVSQIEDLILENRRDEALDMAEFYDANKVGDTEKIGELKQELTPSTWSKVKSVTWNGAIKGEVYDTWSGLGAITADLFIIGDLRDVGIQSWKYASGQQVDKSVLLLSGLGLALSGQPVKDGMASLTKCTIKYVSLLPRKLKGGLVNKLLKRKLPKESGQKIWSLFRANDWSIPKTIGCLSSIRKTKHLDSTLEIIKTNGRSGRAFIHLTGDRGLDLYARTKHPKLKSWLFQAFKKKPLAISGLTKSHLVIHGIKILDKHGLASAVVPMLGLTMALSLLPVWALWLIALICISLIIYRLRCLFRIFTRRKEHGFIKKQTIPA